MTSGPARMVQPFGASPSRQSEEEVDLREPISQSASSRCSSVIFSVFSIHVLAAGGEAIISQCRLFFHAGDSTLVVFMPTMSVPRWADAQKKLEGVTEIVSVIAIETIRTIVDGKLRPESNVDSVSVR
jgi:hypothetical protein